MNERLQVEEAGKGIYRIYHLNCDVDYVILHDDAALEHMHRNGETVYLARKSNDDGVKVKLDFNLYAKKDPNGSELVDY